MATTTRKKKVLLQEVNLEACEQAFCAYNSCTAQLQILEGEMNRELTDVKDRYEMRIARLQEQQEQHFEVMQAYAECNPDRFEKKKSLEFTHGIIGFRTGTPKLKPGKGFTWAGVFEMVKVKLPVFIRTKEELDKERLLADRNTIDLKGLGLEVAQDESFYVAPKLETVSAR